jgi:hypothetical protein
MQNQMIGSIMCEAGLLNQRQVDAVLNAQQLEAERQSFGCVAERLFDIPATVVNEALAEQARQHSAYVKLTEQHLDRNCQYLISPADAWDHLIMPLQFDEDRELICATTVETLPAAIEFVQANLTMPVRFVLADLRLLEQYIAEQYDYEGVEVVEEAA